jgi:large repetitive protein
MRGHSRSASAFCSLALAVSCALWTGCDSLAGIRDGVLASSIDGGLDGQTVTPSDATADTTGPETGTPVEGGSGDSSSFTETGPQDSSGPPAEAESSAPLSPCGNTAGLQPGSPWPMQGGCPTNISQGSVLGPSSAATQWTVTVSNSSTGIAVAANGDLYVCTGTLIDIGADQSIHWESSIACANSPAIGADGTIYISGTNVLTAVTPPATTTGTPTTKWTFNTATGTPSSPNIGGDGTVYVTVGSVVYAVSSTGTQRWTYTAGGPTVGMVALGGTGNVYFGADQLYALSSSGTLLWKANLGPSYPPSVAVSATGDTIYIASENIVGVNSTGTQLWSTSIEGSPWGTPSIAPDGTVYAGANGGNFAAIDPTTGAIKWTYTASDTIQGAPVVDSAGTAFFRTGNNLYAVGTTGALVFSTAVDGYTQPALATGHVLYVGTNGGSVVNYGP